MPDHHYIISGGQEGKSRLNVLADALYPYTHSLLLQHAVSKGVSFLDMGCGGGNVALMVAEMVGAQGRVAGVDFDESIVDLARKDAATYPNVFFETASVYDIKYSGQFDVAYARFLLSHLAEPEKALAKMVDSVRVGGKVIVEDVQFSGHFCYPTYEPFDRYVQYYIAAAEGRGVNAEIGPSLEGLFKSTGLSDVGFDVIQPAYDKGPGKWMAYLTLDRIKNSLVENNLATEIEIDALLNEIQQFTLDETTIISLPQIFRVWGTKC